MEEQPGTRLNKYLALQLGISRREADDLIAGGKVMVNGAPAAMGSRAMGTDAVTVNGKPVIGGTASLCIALNKPAGYVCSRRPQGDTPTIYTLLPKEYYALKPVGRLDKDSSGLILLTNDGDFAHRMTHPSFHKTKTYEVTLHRPLEPLHQQMISDYGIDLPDGKSRFQLMRLHDGNNFEWQVSMHEGRNRQIRRTFAALGYEVTALHRTQFGNYSLGDMKEGEHRLADIQ